MKKRLLPIVLVVFLLLVLAAGGIFLLAARDAASEPELDSSVIVTGIPEPVAEPAETVQRPLESLIFVEGKLYSLVEYDRRPWFDETEYKLYGVLGDSVSRYEEPTAELTTNDEVLVGCEVHEHISEKYSDALAVYTDDADWIFTEYSPVPEEEKTYSFENGQELAELAMRSIEERGYTQIDAEKYELFQFAAIPEECNNFIGVFEHIMEAPDRYRVVQLWYGEDPYQLLVLCQEHMPGIPLDENYLRYYDRTRSQLSPEYAWVVSQAEFIGHAGNHRLEAELYSAEDISGGYGDFIFDVVGKETPCYMLQP